MILKNVEIKARITDYDKVKRLVEDLCHTPIHTEQQEDTFFNSSKGRLKLRESDGESAIIYYDRPNSYEPKQSDIAISFTENPDSLKSVLSKSIGIRGIIKKKRILYKYGQTRIHLDDVEGLGKFIELEVVLEHNQTSKDGETIAYNLMDLFDIQKTDLIDVAYIDLIETNQQ
ncbi:MAG: class IV adenylate cyclase [Candidatus Marinimicrobia bacterium]|nr:class IV adenylate cyclase [Candidatus Neomarinimicrobiota bacterium]